MMLWYSMLQCVAVCCSVLQCVAACSIALCCTVHVRHVHDAGVLQCIAVCCSVLQCVAVCCSMLQHVAACCIIALFDHVRHVRCQVSHFVQIYICMYT